ncbi:MAG: hypothetical protein R2939_20705 [Kofleriaceae bacterium]
MRAAFTLPVASLLLTAACAGSDQDYGGALTDAGAGGGPECFSSSECPVGWTCGDFGTCLPPPGPGPDGGVPPPPPETELEFGPPTASSRFVWVAMTESDALARIDGQTLEVTSTPVGERPRVLTTLPGTDTAIVLDGAHGAVTVVRPSAAGELVETRAILPRLNALAASPSGLHAVAYFDLSRAIDEAGSLEAVGAVGSFQDVSVIGLAAGGARTVDLTVGFRPRAVTFDAAGERAYVITDDGVSVIELEAALDGGPTIVPPIALTADPWADGSALDVEITADGALALAREPGSPTVRVVALTGPSAGDGWDVTLPATPSDVELAPDGGTAYAILRELGAMAVIELPEDALDPSGVELVELTGATLGSLTLTPDGRLGISYTNATLDERVTVIELEAPGWPRHTFGLQKAVRAVAVAPDGDRLLVLHARAGDPGQATVEQFIDRRAGYSTVDLATGFAKLQLTEVDPGPFAFAPDAPRAYLALDGGDAPGATRELHELALDSGVVRVIELGSPPAAVGTLPGTGQVFVAQRHPLGRISFVEVPTGLARTVTGFDLNGQIVD